MKSWSLDKRVILLEEASKRSIKAIRLAQLYIENK